MQTILANDFLRYQTLMIWICVVERTALGLACAREAPLEESSMKVFTPLYLAQGRSRMLQVQS